MTNIWSIFSDFPLKKKIIDLFSIIRQSQDVCWTERLALGSTYQVHFWSFFYYQAISECLLDRKACIRFNIPGYMFLHKISSVLLFSCGFILEPEDDMIWYRDLFSKTRFSRWMLYRHNAAIGTDWNLCFFGIIHCLSKQTIYVYNIHK